MQRKLLIEIEKQETLQREFDPSKIQQIKEDNNGKLVLPVQLQRANAVNANNRVYPKQVLMREADKYQQLIKAKNSLGELDHPDCQTKDHFILCSSGWKQIDSISDNEIVATLNTETREVEYQQITKKIDEPYKGTMYRIHGKNIDTTVTPNHRFLVEDRYGKLKYITGKDIYDIIQSGKNPHLKIPKTGNWNCVEQDTFVLPGVDKESIGYNKQKYTEQIEIDMSVWMEFMGWYLSEGSYQNRTDQKQPYSIKITQKKENGKRVIEEMLSRFPDGFKWAKHEKEDGKTDYIITDARLWFYLSKFGKAPEKYIPEELKQLTPSYLETFLNAFLMGDGTQYESSVEGVDYSVTKAFTTSKQLSDDLQEIMLKLGIASNVKTRIPEDRMIEGRLIKAENSLPLYVLRQETSAYIHIDPRFLQVEKIDDFDDNVYCVRVPNSNFYCMDKNGKCFWTGNSATVSLQNVSHLITEAYWEGDNLMGRIEVLNTPMGMILQSLVESGVLIGVSSRAVGSTRRNAQGYEEVMEDLQLLCWDVVSQPSTPGSWVMTEGQQMLDGKRIVDPKVDKMLRFFQSAQNYLYNKNQ